MCPKTRRQIKHSIRPRKALGIRRAKGPSMMRISGQRGVFKETQESQLCRKPELSHSTRFWRRVWRSQKSAPKKKQARYAKTAYPDLRPPWENNISCLPVINHWQATDVGLYRPIGCCDFGNLFARFAFCSPAALACSSDLAQTELPSKSTHPSGTDAPMILAEPRRFVRKWDKR